MSRVFRIVLAATLALVFIVGPAGAQDIGVACSNRHTGNWYRTICVETNQNQLEHSRQQGLIDLSAPPYDDTRVLVRVDYVRLWYCTYFGGCQIEKTDPDGGLYDTLYTGSVATPWWDCNLPNLADGTVKSSARFQVTWPNGTVGPWVTLYSNDFNPGACP